MSMTSTPFNVGLAGDGSRSSSRVLRPPGGGHTDIFGGEPEPTRGRRQGYAQPASSIGEHDPESQPQSGKGRRQGYPQSNNIGEHAIGVSDASEQTHHYDGFSQAFSADDDLQQVRGKRHFSQPLDSVYPLAARHDYMQTVDDNTQTVDDNNWSAEPERGGHHKYAHLLDRVEQEVTDAVAQELKACSLDGRPPAGDIEKHDLDRRHYTQPTDAIYQPPAAARDNERPEHKMDRRHFAQPRDALYLLADASHVRNGCTQTGDLRSDDELGGRHHYVQSLASYEQSVGDGETPEPRKGKRHGCSQTERPAAGDVEKHDHDRRHFISPYDAIYEHPTKGKRPQTSLHEQTATETAGRPHKYAQLLDSIEQEVTDAVAQELRDYTLDERLPAGDIGKHDLDRRHYTQPTDAIYQPPATARDNERPEHKLDRRHFASPHDAIYEHPAKAKPPQSSICEQMVTGQCWAAEPAGRRQHTAICGIGVFDDGGEAPRGRRQFARAAPAAPAICEQPLGACAPEPPRGKRRGPPPPPSFGQGDEPKPKNGIEPQNGNVTPDQPSAPETTPEPVQEAKSSQPESAMARASQPEPARAEAPKRVRVPPGGFSSGLW